MAFVDDSDLKPKAVAQVPRRSRLVPVLLITLNLGVVALLAVVLLPQVSLPWGSTEPAGVSQLDPKLLETPTGRRLEVVQFGNAVFEVTRVTYFPDLRSRSVTITVPGDPPQWSIFRVGESFANGRIRVVDIDRSGVVLAHGEQQRRFAVDGSDGAPPPRGMEIAPGPSMMPATGRTVIPDLPSGAIRPAQDPRLAPTPEPAPAREPAPETLEDLPYELRYPLTRTEYNELLRNLADTMERDFVLAGALDAQSRSVYGLKIMNIAPSCILAANGLRRGDVLLDLNETPISRWQDIYESARRVTNATELRMVIERTEPPAPGEEPVTEIITLVYTPDRPERNAK